MRKIIEGSGTAFAEPMSLAQLDSLCKKETVAGAAMAKFLNLKAQ